jgi:hypothetical protein
MVVPTGRCRAIRGLSRHPGSVEWPALGSSLKELVDAPRYKDLLKLKQRNERAMNSGLQARGIKLTRSVPEDPRPPYESLTRLRREVGL